MSELNRLLRGTTGNLTQDNKEEKRSTALDDPPAPPASHHSSSYISELAQLISASISDMSTVTFKPEKRAILQETVKEINRIKRESTNRPNEAVQQSDVSSSKPTILANEVLGPLLLEALDGFLFVVNSQGKVEFVSENIAQYLKYNPCDVVAKSIYNIIHVGDHAQFSSSLLPMSVGGSLSWPREGSLGNCSRTFYCRMLIKPPGEEDDDVEVKQTQISQYETMQISTIPQNYSSDRTQLPLDSDIQSCLVCIARRLSLSETPTTTASTMLGIEQFTTKQAPTGKILMCNMSEIKSAHYKYTEFVGQNIQDFCHVNDVQQLSRHLQEVLKNGSDTSGVYRFKIQETRYVFVRSTSKLAKEGEEQFVLSTHSIIRECDTENEMKGSASTSLMKSIIQSNAGTPQMNLLALGSLRSNLNVKTLIGSGRHRNNQSRGLNLHLPSPGQCVNDLLSVMEPGMWDIGGSTGELSNAVGSNSQFGAEMFPGIGGGGGNVGSGGLNNSDTFQGGRNNNIPAANISWGSMGSPPPASPQGGVTPQPGGLVNSMPNFGRPMMRQRQTSGSRRNSQSGHDLTGQGSRQRSPGYAGAGSTFGLSMNFNSGSGQNNGPGAGAYTSQRSPGVTSPAMRSLRSPSLAANPVGGPNVTMDPSGKFTTIQRQNSVGSDIMSPTQRQLSVGSDIISPTQSLPSSVSSDDGRSFLLGMPTQPTTPLTPSVNSWMSDLHIQQGSTTNWPRSGPPTPTTPQPPTPTRRNPKSPMESSETVDIRASMKNWSPQIKEQIYKLCQQKQPTGEQKQRLAQLLREMSRDGAPHSNTITTTSAAAAGRNSENGGRLRSPEHQSPTPGPGTSPPEEPQSSSMSVDDNLDSDASGQGTKVKDKLTDNTILKQLLSQDDDSSSATDGSADSNGEVAVKGDNLERNEAEAKKPGKNVLLKKLLNEDEKKLEGKKNNMLLTKLLSEEEGTVAAAESTSQENNELTGAPSSGLLQRELACDTTPSSSQQNNDDSFSSLFGNSNNSTDTFSRGGILDTFLSNLWDRQTAETDVDNVRQPSTLKRKLSTQDVDSTESIDTEPSSSGGPKGGASGGGGQKNQLLAQLLTKRSKESNVSTTTMSNAMVNATETPQSKLPKNLQAKILSHPQQRQQQQQQSLQQQQGTLGFKSPDSTADATQESRTVNPRDNPRTNPDAPFPGNTNVKDQGTAEGGGSNSGINIPASRPSNLASSTNQENLAQLLMAGGVQAMQQPVSSDSAPTPAPVSLMSMPQNSSLASNDPLLAQILQTATDLQNDISGSNNSFRSSNQDGAGGGGTLTFDQPMTDDQTLLSQLEQALYSTDMPFPEIEHLLGGHNSLGQRGTFDEQSAIDAIEKQLLSDMPPELGGGHGSQHQSGSNTSTTLSFSSPATRGQDQGQGQMNMGQGILSSSGQQQQQQQQPGLLQQQLTQRMPLPQQQQQQQQQPATSQQNMNFSQGRGRFQDSNFGGMNQQRSNFPPLGNNNASPKMSAQVRQTLALQRQQHLRQRLVQQQMTKNRASQMIRQQQQGFSGSGFGQFGQQGMDQQSQSTIPENFTELLNSGAAPNVSLPVQRTPGIPSHTNSLSPGDNFMNVMGSQGMMGQGQGRMSPQISPQYNQSQNQWNVHHSPGGGMQNTMMQQPRGNQYGGIPQRQMTSHSQSMGGQMAGVMTSHSQSIGGQMSGVMTSHSQSMGGQMSGVMTSQTMGSGQQNHFQFPQPDSQFSSPGGNPQMNMYGQQPQQQNMIQNRMMQRQMNMPVRAQSPRGQLSPYGNNTGQPQDTVMMSPNMSQLSPSSQLASSGMYAQTSPLSTSSLQGSFDQDMGLYSNAMDMNVSTSSAPNATSQFVRQEVRAMCSARLQNQQQQQLPPPPPQQQQQVLQNQQQMTFDTGEIPMDLIDQITELEAISQQQQQQSQQQQQPQQTHHPHHPQQSPGGSNGGTQYDSNGQPIREEVVVSQTRQEARQRYQQFRQLSSGVVTAVPVVEEDPESTATNVFRNQLRTPAQIAAANQSSRQRVPSARDMPQVNVVQTEPRAPVEDLRPANQRNSLLQQLLSDP